MLVGLAAFVGALRAALVGDPSMTDATTAVPSMDLPQALSFASNALNSSRAAWIGLALLLTLILGAAVIAGNAGRKGVELPKL